MSETFARQWAILKMIPKYPSTIDSLTVGQRLRDQGLGATTPRTIQRDLEMLSQSFPLAMVDPSRRPIQWHWANGAAPLDIPALDPAEAVVMKLVETYLTPLLPGAMLDALAPHFDSAERILKSEGGLGPARWTHRIRVLPKGIHLLQPKIDAAAQKAVYDALLRETQLELAYRRRGSTRDKLYQVNPLGLVVRDSVIYLVASLVESGELRQFVIHRVTSARALDEPATSPRGFDLDKYIEEGGFGWPTGKRIRLVAIFGRGPAQTLFETRLSADQTMQKLNEEQFRVTATVLETVELHWWLMSFGPEVEVIAPKPLRKFMAGAAKTTLASYQKRMR